MEKKSSMPSYDSMTETGNYRYIQLGFGWFLDYSVLLMEKH